MIFLRALLGGLVEVGAKKKDSIHFGAGNRTPTSSDREM